MERSTGGETLLHQLEHSGHAWTLELWQDGSTLKLMVNHLNVGLDTTDEVCALWLRVRFYNKNDKANNITKRNKINSDKNSIKR